MRKIATFALAAVLTTMIFGTRCVASGAAHSIPWGSSYASAVADAKARHTLVMADMYTSWCGWCKVLDAKVYPQPEVIAAASSFSPVKLDAEKEGAGLTQKFSISGFPTVLFIEPDGTLFTRLIGYQDPAQFTASLKQIQQDHAGIALAEARLRTAPNDLGATLKLAEIDADIGRVQSASSYVPKLEAAGYAPKLPHLYNGLGDCYAERQDYPDAIAYFHKTLAQRAAPFICVLKAHGGLLQCFARQNNMSGVKQQLQQIIHLPGVTPNLKQHAQAMLLQVSSAKGAPQNP